MSAPAPDPLAGEPEPVLRRRRVSRNRRRHRLVRRIRRTLLVVLAAMLLMGVYVGFRAFQVRGDLMDVRRQAATLSGAIAEGDRAGATEALAQMQVSAGNAADHTTGPSWRLLEVLPVVGDDAKGVRQVARVADDLARDGVTPLVESADQLAAGAFTPQGKQFPLRVIAGLAVPAEQSYNAFLAADQRLAAVDSSGFLPQFAPVFEDLAARVHDATRLLGSASKAAVLLPSLLGREGPREYLLVLQNNAEVRSSGGLPGSISLVRADEGRVKIAEQRPAAEFVATERPVLPLTGEELSIFGENLGKLFLDANFTPDFPRAAELMRARWEIATGTNVDGVFIIDPVTVSYLLEWTGPIQAGAATLTSQNAVDVLLHQTYVRLETQEEQDALFELVARKTFDAFADGAGDPVGIVKSLIRGVDEGRLFAWSAEDSEQEILGTSAIGGALPVANTDRPQIGVYLNDGTGAKMQYFLDYDVTVQSTGCVEGVQSTIGEVRLVADTPPDIASQPVSVIGSDLLYDREKGSQFVVAHVYGPVGGRFTSLEVNGKTITDPVVLMHHGRPVATLGLLVGPDGSALARWETESGVGQSGDIDVAVTPGVQSGTKSSVVASSC